MFTPRPYPKSELAMLYMPGISPQSATRTLNRWIAKCTMLQAELAQLKYNPRRHTLLKREVEAIVKHLGEP
jgi:hypothetical protein